MRKLWLLLVIGPLFLVSPVIALVVLGLGLAAVVPYTVAALLRVAAKGVKGVGDGLTHGAVYISRGQDALASKRGSLITEYHTISEEDLAAKQAAYDEALREEARAAAA